MVFTNYNNRKAAFNLNLQINYHNYPIQISNCHMFNLFVKDFDSKMDVKIKVNYDLFLVN